MAEIFRKGYRGYSLKQGGKGNLEELIAHHVTVQRGVDSLAQRTATDAAAVLEARRDRGDSKILTERGRVDRFVILSDERGSQAAAAIEYGRKGHLNEDGILKGAQAGVAPLRTAIGSARKNWKPPRVPKGE